ncbi:recombinase family protein [Actinokineospora guangxiensis]|uniref:Recombinase family protein n=1 Tax=Actinokineospora guangxiensis TaxID=1490288 RepID=A0ABW0EXL0_9PSEU
MNGAPVVYGYVRSMVDDSTYVAECKEQLASWCAREGWVLDAVFVDSGGALDDERIGFRGLLDALSLPQAAAVVVLNAVHLSPKADIAVRLVQGIRRTGCALKLRDGELPEQARRLWLGEPERKK